ncbi:hypothetical protein VNO78_17784 [Psophocarpus tetragonolobus]|uniref:Uncharacterized protein n=1 Tax=Psophocarpus tetragonolobus TaxID=3891 RepID=A0AAN9SHC3_PSOTE
MLAFQTTLPRKKPFVSLSALQIGASDSLVSHVEVLFYVAYLHKNMAQYSYQLDGTEVACAFGCSSEDVSFLAGKLH